MLVGAGFLFPFNSYVAAGDYFSARYAEHDPLFYMPLTYMLVTAISVLFLLCVGLGRVELRWRIRFGYVVFICALLGVLGVEALLAADLLSNTAAYGLLLVTVAITSLGSGVQQSSYYG